MSDTTQSTNDTQAKLYRMDMPDHLCPYGLKSRHLLRSKGFEIDDHRLTTREEVDRFMEEAGVKTTPQTYIGETRIGGYEALREHFGQSLRKEGETTYVPVIAIFAMSALIALAIAWAAGGGLFSARTLEWFAATAMSLLAVQKLSDVESFSSMFLNYDLLAQKWVPYGYLYPFGEALAGVLMIAGALIWLAAPVALVIGTVGAVSVFKAVYIDKRELKCACVGGGSDVPLGFVSLTENLVMVAMGLWMLLK